MYKKDIEQTVWLFIKVFKNKLTKLVSSDMEKPFSDANDSSDIEEQIIKQIKHAEIIRYGTL